MSLMFIAPLHRGLVFLSAALLLSFVLSACPDPCLLGGNACNVDEDCPADQHCLAQRGHVGGGDCSLVKGSCQPRELCDTAADCLDGQCCDSLTHRCAPEGACTSRCEKNDDCNPVEVCSTQIERCRQSCVLDGIQFACDPGSVCVDYGGYCTPPVGSPCDPEDSESCGHDMVCVAQRVVSGCEIKAEDADQVQLSQKGSWGYCALMASYYRHSCRDGMGNEISCPSDCPAGSCFVMSIEHGDVSRYCYPPAPQAR